MRKTIANDKLLAYSTNIHKKAIKPAAINAMKTTIEAKRIKTSLKKTLFFISGSFAAL